MDTPITNKNKALQETETPNSIKAYFAKQNPPGMAAAEPQSSMPTKLLGDRIGKDIGIGGFFRALWNYISNSSTKSLDQAKLNVAAKDYLKNNSGEVDNILREITANRSPQDPHIVHAFITALKEIDQEKFDGLCAAAKGFVDGVLTEGAQTSSGITPANIKHAVDLVDRLKSVIKFSPSALALHSLAQKLPVDQIEAQITPELITFCNDFPRLAQKLPAERITPELITFCNDCPEQARTLAERQDFHQKSFRGTNDDEGMLLVCNDSGYKPGILGLIDQGLFEGDRRDTRIESFLKDQAVTNNLFCKDGIQRYEMPHITLPNGVEILSNIGRSDSEYCKSTSGSYDQAAYLKYMLDQFKTAYGSTDEAIKAFKVFVQNFTGTGNTWVGVLTRPPADEAVFPGIDIQKKASLIGGTLAKNRIRSTMRMDADFNITFNATVCVSNEEGIQRINKTTKSSFPKDTICGITISSYIPAVINDTMDQCGQEGRQTTTFEIIGSLGSGGSN
ncbi:MAG: hypothetical protein LBI47_01245 [Puniceicoccales bacterium]|jgi:hypothetical protein|nr:hypothetical protein [Puniceicoccales bacterium]